VSFLIADRLSASQKECVVPGASPLLYLESWTESKLIESAFKNEGVVSVEGFYFKIFHPHYNRCAERTVTSEMKDLIPIVFTFPHNVLISRSTLALSRSKWLPFSVLHLYLFLILLSFHDNVAISVASQSALSLLCSYWVDYTIWLICSRDYIVRKSRVPIAAIKRPSHLTITWASSM
jgi:hypothetical protein